MIIDNIAQSSGKNGITPHIGANGNWWIDDVDTGVKAQGQDGNAGVTPRIDETTGHWFIGETDTGVKAAGSNGEDGTSPHIGDNGNWFIGEQDTGVKAQGENGVAGTAPHIDDATGNWFIGEVDTGVKAKGTDGKDGTDGTDGIDGITPHIGANGNWFIGDTDTGTAAQAGSDTSIIPVTLISSNWSTDNASQNISVSGILEDETKQIITIVPFDSSMELYEACEIECTAFGVDNLTFTAKTIPAEDISIYVILENVTGDNKVANNVYSTEETVVGTWIDGRPIYRMCMYDVLPTTGDVTDVRSDIPWKGKNMDNLVNIYGSIYGSSTYPNIRASIFDSTVMRLWVTPTSMCIVMKAEQPTYLGRPFYLVVEYTKTTDTATIEIPSATALMDEYQKGVQES